MRAKADLMLRCACEAAPMSLYELLQAEAALLARVSQVWRQDVCATITLAMLLNAEERRGYKREATLQ